MRSPEDQQKIDEFQTKLLSLNERSRELVKEYAEIGIVVTFETDLAAFSELTTKLCWKTPSFG